MISKGAHIHSLKFVWLKLEESVVMTTIFVIHGMGTFQPGWFKGDNGTLSEIAKLKRFDGLKGNNDTLESLVEDVRWEELIYDDLSEKIRTATENGTEFDNLIAGIGNNENSSASEEALNAWKDETLELTQNLNPFNRTDFLRDNVWDVFVVANKLTRHYLALNIVDQILENFQRNGVPQSWSILAHSLGTGLIQDVLNILYELLLKDGYISKPRVVCLIANFSRTKIGNILVSSDPANAETSVWPSKGYGNSMCRYYISARHKLDPLSYLADEMPDPWLQKPSGFLDSCYRVFEHKDLNFIPNELDPSDPVALGSHIHSLPNYFAHPVIHLTFLYRALGKGARITPKVERDATTAFLETRKPTPINFANIIAQNDLSSVTSWAMALAKTGAKFGV